MFEAFVICGENAF